jgi:hypothetical protein
MPSNQLDHGTSSGASLRLPHVDSHHRDDRFLRWPSPARRSRSEISDPRGARWALATCVVLLLGRPLMAADKVDVIHLKNGDRLTCEIKKLDRSILTIGTDPLGNASVHWGEVVDLTSPRKFDVQLASGEHDLGSLLTSPRLEGGSNTTLALADVIRLAPIGGASGVVSTALSTPDSASRKPIWRRTQASVWRIFTRRPLRVRSSDSSKAENLVRTPASEIVWTPSP